MNEVHAAAALSVLDSIDDIIDRNRQRHQLYMKSFSGIPGVSFISPASNQKINYELSILEISDDWPYTMVETLNMIRAENVLSRPYYSPPLHMYPEHKGNTEICNLHVTESFVDRFIQMPVGEMIVDNDIECIALLFKFLYINRNAVLERLRKEPKS